MRESGYYPPGAEFDPHAPWNEKEQKALGFIVDVETTVFKRDKVFTSDYIEFVDYNDECVMESIIDTDDVDWEKAWKSQHLSIIDLLLELKTMCEAELKNESPQSSRACHLRKIISECDCWEEYDTNVASYEQC